MNKKKYKGRKLEFHIIQSFPVTCLNRDDVNSPKTAIVGGVTRARVSSQCWKRQVRMQMHEFGLPLAVRTKNIAKKIAGYCIKNGADEQKALEVSKTIADILSKDTLHFFTESEAEGLASYAQECEYSSESINKNKKEVFKIHKEQFHPAQDGFDIALFGRMVANAKTEKIDLDIEAAVAFSHAITTHKASNEVEFFTALDDFPGPEDTASSHLGSLEFNSGTYYRYVSIDLGQLAHTLDNTGGEEADMLKALDIFVKALFVAVPSARQATQAGFSPWDFARVYIRRGQRLQASFDEPVRADNGYSKPSIKALKEFLDTKETQHGTLFGKIQQFEFGEDKNYSIDTLVEDIHKALETE